MKKVLLGAVFAASTSGWAVPDTTATFYVNGVKIEDKMQMELMYHTAEVKPAGTVVSSTCGKVKTGLYTEVCVSTAQGKKSQYLEVRKKSGGTVYVRTNVTPKGIGFSEHTGFGVDDDDKSPRYQVEKEFRLVVQE
jgi:hypothetical protein